MTNNLFTSYLRIAVFFRRIDIDGLRGRNSVLEAISIVSTQIKGPELAFLAFFFP